MKKNIYRTPGERTVGFGKYRFKTYAELPTDYLKWFIESAFPQMKVRKQYAADELKRRSIV